MGLYVCGSQESSGHWDSVSQVIHFVEIYNPLSINKRLQMLFTRSYRNRSASISYAAWIIGKFVKSNVSLRFTTVWRNVNTPRVSTAHQIFSVLISDVSNHTATAVNLMGIHQVLQFCVAPQRMTPSKDSAAKLPTADAAWSLEIRSILRSTSRRVMKLKPRPVILKPTSNIVFATSISTTVFHCKMGPYQCFEQCL